MINVKLILEDIGFFKYKTLRNTKEKVLPKDAAISKYNNIHINPNTSLFL